MKLDYFPISLEHKSEYLSLLSSVDSQASDLSLGNLLGWGPHYGLKWRFEHDFCWIKQGDTSTYWAPVGSWSNVKDWSIFPEFSPGNKFTRVPEVLASIWQEQFPSSILCEEDRNNWDYLYLTSELSALSGNKFHKKKNLLKQFQKTYSYEYQPMTESHLDLVRSMQAAWYASRPESSEALLAENDAIERVLSHWSDIPNLRGGLIFVEGSPVAYTIGEPINKDTFVVHFEKADTAIKGGYQAINYFFCNDIGEEFMHINREQDLGEEGLRQAKISYNPSGFAKKFTVTIK